MNPGQFTKYMKGKLWFGLICFCSHSALPVRGITLSICLAKSLCYYRINDLNIKIFPVIRFLYIYNLTLCYDLTITQYLGKLYLTFSLKPSIMSWGRPQTSRFRKLPMACHTSCCLEFTFKLSLQNIYCFWLAPWLSS